MINIRYPLFCYVLCVFYPQTLIIAYSVFRILFFGRCGVGIHSVITLKYHVCLFWVARAIFQLSWYSHHYWWQDLHVCLALRLLAVRDLLRATPTATRILLFKVISERPVILTSECCALGEGAITTYFKRLGFDAAGPSGARTHDLLDAKREHYMYH
jgi:hypothetical protein